MERDSTFVLYLSEFTDEQEIQLSFMKLRDDADNKELRQQLQTRTNTSQHEMQAVLDNVHEIPSVSVTEKTGQQVEAVCLDMVLFAPSQQVRLVDEDDGDGRGQVRRLPVDFRTRIATCLLSVSMRGPSTLHSYQ